MNWEKDKSPGLSGSVLECARDGAGRWGQVLESRQGGSCGACLGSWTFLRAIGSPEGQQHQVSILGRVLQGKKQDCGLNPGAGLTQGQARRDGQKWVDMRDTEEIQQDSSKSIYFLEEKKEMETE